LHTEGVFSKGKRELKCGVYAFGAEQGKGNPKSRQKPTR